MPNFVVDIFCTDGSLTFTPSTGHVIGSLNTSHVNHFLVTQYFQSANVGLPAASFKGVSGQVAPYVQATDYLSVVMFEAGPPIYADCSATITARNAVGNVGFQWDGKRLLLVDRHSGNGFGITCGSQTLLEDNQLWLATTLHNFSTDGRISLGTALAGGGLGIKPAQLYVDGSDLHEAQLCLMKGKVGGFVIDAFTVSADGTANVKEEFSVGIYSPTGDMRVNVSVPDDRGGIRIATETSSPAGGLMLSVQPFASDPTFAVAEDGSLWTGQVASASTPGTVIGKFPLYDGTGALVGYLPVYDDIT